MDRRTFLSLAAALPAFQQSARPPAKPAAPAPVTAKPPAPAATHAAVPWTQWGGPHRNFQTQSPPLKDTWPAAGPPIVWKRQLGGDGYSAPAVEADALYTMYGRRNEEVVLAASTTTGATLWEHATPMTFHSDAPEQGNGPYSAPLVVGDRLFTTGVDGRLQCLEKRTGKVVWTQQLWSGLKGSPLMYGYASSPIAYRQLVIVPVGGPGRALMAFQQSDASVAWSRGDLPNAYSSPLLIDLDGLEQLAVLMDGAVFAVNPINGDPQWQVPFKADYSIAVSMPVWGADHLMFVSSEYNGGTKVIQLQRNGTRTNPAELWTSNRLRLHHGNAMRIGDAVYFSSGGKGSQAILSAVDVKTGKIYWQERSIEKATFVWADGKLITLAQDGALMIAHPTMETFQISARASLLSSLAWTPPVLVGSRAYLRDRRTLMAVELG